MPDTMLLKYGGVFQSFKALTFSVSGIFKIIKNKTNYPTSHINS